MYDGLLLSNQNHKPLAARDAGIEQITLQHGIVLRHDRDHHGWVFRLHWLPRSQIRLRVRRCKFGDVPEDLSEL